MNFEKALGSVAGSGGDAIINFCDFQEKSWLKTELYRWNPLNKGQYRGKAENNSEPVETARSAPRNRMKIQSDLHGNMQRLVEISSPSFVKMKVTTVTATRRSDYPVHQAEKLHATVSCKFRSTD